ncbi:dolichyl-phosphate-mannose--protein mannosyltransferase [Flaviflexus salsibiostraticola]|uniref:dolichyl-phosphate-mannose--protein mannosyltransferase n=1 Tax=Flaviflexus salsibiostraticola TaxID=1282737 RepID=UPI0013DDD2F5|nr:phospholipid carrier-dependent glycosyltransferase [Flaviflexus salsibiostraticola]
MIDQDSGPKTRELSERESAAWEIELRGRLGLVSTLPAQIRLWGWIVTAIAALLAAVTRLTGLTHPHQMVFDETYYVKGGYSLITYGYERDWVGSDADEMFVQGLDAAADTIGDYVVHPPLGKWLIGFGQALFGTDNGFGWRFATALAGIISVILITRIALHLFRSVPLAFAAGAFMALDGVGIVLSRTGILDSLLAVFVLAGFWAVLHDRDWTRRRLARRVAHGPVDREGRPLAALGPIILFRPWLLAAGVLIGLGCGVKWSAIYALAVFGILVFVWDTAAKRAIGVRRWFTSGVLTGGAPAFVNLVPIAIPTYLLAWLSWFLDPRGYRRGWAEMRRTIGEEVPFEQFGDTIAEFISYHRQMWGFHTGLDSEHTYMSQPWDWLLQLRPVNFYWPPEEKLVQDCGAERCVQAISSIGNPAVWWLAAASLIVVLWYAIVKSDWRAWAIVAGYGATYLPWYGYIGRTIYQFYSVAFLPFVVLALVFGLAWATDTLTPPNLTAVRRAAARRLKKRGAEDWTLTISPDEERTEDPSTHAHAAQSAISSEPAAMEAGTAAARTAPSPSDPEDSPYLDEPDLDHEDSASVEPDPIERAVATMGGPEALSYELHLGSKRASLIFSLTYGFVIAFAILWWPLWTGMTIPYEFWKLHIWLPGWS